MIYPIAGRGIYDLAIWYLPRLSHSLAPMAAKIRLYVDHPLEAGQLVPLSREQAHYLFGVMRMTVGGAVALFNGHDGEWQAEIVETGKRGGLLRATRQSAALQLPPDLWLLFAPIKKARTDFIVEKAAELGVRRILPVQTEFTNTTRLPHARLVAHAIEAAEQCGGTFVPEVAELTPLASVLKDWPSDRALMFCDEELAGAAHGLPNRKGPWAILIGPEGGFSERERTRIASLEQSYSVSLGPRILRADTAAVAALALWQSALGDWA